MAHTIAPTTLMDADGKIPDLLIEGATIVFPGGGVTKEKSVLLRGGRIEAILPSSGAVPPGAIRVNGSGNFLTAGFIDLHIHGTGAHLVDEGKEALEALTALLPKYGVTGFLPTVLPDSKASHIRLFEQLSHARSRGSHILGFFSEGPFLSIPGSLSIDPGQRTDADWITRIQKAADPYGVVFAISPEFPDIRELFPLMRARGMPIFITHTRAGVADTLEAIQQGARHATHFYDVFPLPPEAELGVRPCGAVEAILADSTVSVDFILDGYHVDPIAVQMALTCKGVENVCLITDANRGAGAISAGTYRFGNYSVSFSHEGAPARLGPDHPDHPGALAGSGLTMDKAVRNAVKLLGIGLDQAVCMASYAPAKVLGLQDRKGKIEPGYDADLVLLDDKTLKPVRTWVAGREVFRAD